jgi:hypothetical protein
VFSALLITLAHSTLAAGQVCNTFRVRPQDQIWIVSTRCLGCPVGGREEPYWQVWRYENGWWQPSSSAEFYKTDAGGPVTPIYIHGNRYDHSEAIQEGLTVYFQFVGRFDDEPPVRWVIWSWPSSQIRGPLRDVRSKAARSDVDGYYLGRFIARMQPDVRVGMVGFSFAGRIASGALHVSEGGMLVGHWIPRGPRPKVRVALWGAAEHSHWYIPGQYHDRALYGAEAWFVPINCCDNVLRRYHWIEKHGNPDAVGYAGIYGRNLLPAEINSRIEEVNVSHIVGSTHSVWPYVNSGYIQGRTRQYILWHELYAQRQDRESKEHALAADE